MIKKYIAIEHKNSKYCKGVPYISKKEFKKNKNNLIVGKTKLKKYKSSSENKDLDLLLFNDKEFEIKERLFTDVRLMLKKYQSLDDESKKMIMEFFQTLIKTAKNTAMEEIPAFNRTNKE